MASQFDVIVLGSYSIDLIFSGMREFPQLGKDTVSNNFKVTPGEAYISAVSMHRLGIKVGWAADFGNDEYSQMALKSAREEGLDDSLFVMHEQPYRRISVAASFPNERGFLTYYDQDPTVPAALSALARSTSKFVYIPGLYTGPLFNLGLKLIRRKKMKLAMDGNSSQGTICDNTKESIAVRKAILSTDIFLPNAQEARRITGEEDLYKAIQTLGKLCPIVIVKDGPNGSYAHTDNGIIHVPGIQVNPVDTTGAGDNFNSGFLRAWLDGKQIESCLQWGNIAGGLSTKELGGTTFRIDCERILKELSRYYQ